MSEPPKARMTAKDRARLAAERLKALYPAVSELAHTNPFQMLVATILSAQTTDRSVNSVTPALFASYPDAAALAHANPAEVEAIIKPTGFYHVTAAGSASPGRRAARSVCSTTSARHPPFGPGAGAVP